MKILIVLIALVSLPAFARDEAPLGEGRCFDLKESVLADLSRSCGKVDAALAKKIETLDKRCGQPQLARLFRKTYEKKVAANASAPSGVALK